MRLLIWHCSRVRYTDRRPSNRPADVHVEAPQGETTRHGDVLLVLTTVERDDRKDHVADATSAVLELEQVVRPRDGIVVMPFAHLSAELADPAIARQHIAALAESLTAAGALTATSTFGFHKDLELCFAARGHPGSVAYRAF